MPLSQEKLVLSILNMKKIFSLFFADIFNSKLFISIVNPLNIFSMILLIILSKKEGPSFFSILLTAYLIKSFIIFFLLSIIIFSISSSFNSDTDKLHLILFK